MPYEVRTFTQCNKDALKNEGSQQTSFLDIYIYKRQFTSIGVKIRKPKLIKDENTITYKFKNIEIKVHSKPYYWNKYVLDCKFNGSLEDWNILNKILAQPAINLGLQDWANAPISDIFYIKKQKNKFLGNEIGNIAVTSKLISQTLYFETRCLESIFAPKQGQPDESYPAFLERIFTSTQSKLLVFC